MKKILVEGMSHNLGGMESFIHLLFYVMHSSWQMDFLIYDETIPFQKEFQDAGCKIHWITSRSKGIKKSQKEIDSVFDNENYDVFWFNKTTLSNIYSLKSARKHGVKKVVCHGHTSKNMGSPFTACMHFINRTITSKYVDYKVACSKEAAKYFFGNSNDSIIINNAVDLKRYEPNPEKIIKMKKKLDLEDTFVIGHIGRFSPEKNHTFLIDVFEEIYKSEGSHLLLCGNGDLMKDVKNKVELKKMEKNVSFLGLRNDIPDLLQAMDVLVMPSLFEGLPFSLVEAQAAGVPCIVSNTVSKDSKLTDIIQFLSLDSSSKEWADCILKYRNYKKVSKSNQLIDKGFSLDSFIDQIKNIVE